MCNFNWGQTSGIILQFCLWMEKGYVPVSSVGSSESIIDINISQFRKRGSESIHFSRISLDLKGKNDKFVLFKSQSRY